MAANASPRGRVIKVKDRGAERDALDGLVLAVRAGESRSLVVRGDPGVGKTVLLDYLAGQAHGCRIARMTGVQSEMELAFAGLHQLCAPMLADLGRIPAPQQAALQTAFGVAAGPPPDRFLVGLAVLSLLSAAARERPLVCLIDDTQWIDQASVQALGFAARRLVADQVAMVFATRDPGVDLAGLAVLDVGGLRGDDARALLESALAWPLDARVRELIVAEARGNPLALLELPRGLTPAELAGGFGLPGAVPLTGRIEDSFARQMAALPDQTRQLLQLAAADPTGDQLLVWRAAGQLGIPVTAAASATEAGLVEFGGRVRFRHPLVRSVAYRSASFADRQQMHAALAQATDPQADPDRRAWHRAQAAPGPDEQVAVELERSAGRAQARGGLAAAAAFLERSVALTDDPARRAERTLAAAQACLQAGAFDSTRTLLDVACAGPVDELQRARIDLLRARLAFALSRGSDAPSLLLTAARRLESLDLELARETYVDAFIAAMFGARLNEGIDVRDVARAARAAPGRSDGDRSAASLLLDALAAVTDDYGTGVPLCQDALRELSGDKISSEEQLRWSRLGCAVALELWDDNSAYLLSRRSVRTAREAGSPSELALALDVGTAMLVFCGELSAAASMAAETQSVQEATGINAAHHGALVLAAWRGRPREARNLIELTTREAALRGEGSGLTISEYAHAVLCNGAGQYVEGLAAARSASEHQEIVRENWVLPELIESAVRTGRTDLAEDALTRLAAKAQASGTDWALGVEARSRALLREGDQADAGFREAIDRLSRTRVRAELARAHLLYGEWLRREQRGRGARAELRMAHDMLDTMGMEAFAERARRELLATGEMVRNRSVETISVLTAQEAHIARLAREGRTNPEIGAQLFLSARTVEWHLRKVFTKLGITSRRELSAALTEAGPPA